MPVPGPTAQRLDAGTQRYSVGIETPRFSATSRGDIPSLKSLRADSTFPGVIRRLRPPSRPRRHRRGSCGEDRQMDVVDERLGQGEAEPLAIDQGVDLIDRGVELVDVRL